MKRIKLKEIDLIVYDFDGVMTDNKVLVSEDGREAVFCNRSDGLAIRKIKGMGVPQIILSTEKDGAVSSRAKKLQVEVIQGVDDKLRTLSDYCEKRNYSLLKVVYIGNDINDLEVMKKVGFAMAPEDAYEPIKKVAKVILNTKGGQGVIRELLEYFEIDYCNGGI